MIVKDKGNGTLNDKRNGWLRIKEADRQEILGVKDPEERSKHEVSRGNYKAKLRPILVP